MTRKHRAICNRARYLGEPESLCERFSANWLADRPIDNRFDPQELVPLSPAWAIRQNNRSRGVES